MTPAQIQTSRTISGFVQLLQQHFDSDNVTRVIEEYSLERDEVLNSVYWENPDAGLSIKSCNNLVESVFLHAEGKDGFRQFSLESFDGIGFNSTFRNVRERFGHPSQSSMPDTVCDGISHGGWDRYDLDCCSIHFTYWSSNGRVELLTLISPKESTGSSCTQELLLQGG